MFIVGIVKITDCYIGGLGRYVERNSDKDFLGSIDLVSKKELVEHTVPVGHIDPVEHTDPVGRIEEGIGLYLTDSQQITSFFCFDTDCLNCYFSVVEDIKVDIGKNDSVSYHSEKMKTSFNLFSNKL